MASARTAAAQYIRMSTDRQDLSPAIQESAINEYAQRHGLDVVATYLDAGRSGVRIADRPALKKLLADVMARPVFTRILVYDVSRWGRFQDVDAAAYYEYHCRLHGIEVSYVAEPFGDELSPMQALLKSMKRAMAAEYSRDLAVKSRAGQQRVIDKGFQMGSPPLGFRRLSVSADGSRSTELRPGQRKLAATDRIRWVLGPAQEVAVVRRIFALYAHTKCSERGLIKRAAAEGWKSVAGTAVTESNIKSLLRNEAVIGNFVWGKDKPKPGKRIVTGGLTRSVAQLPRIVDDETWALVQAKLRAAGGRVRSTEQMIHELRLAITKDPGLTSSDLARHGCASISAYKARFGSWTEALRRAGASVPAVARNVFDRARDKRNLAIHWGRELSTSLSKFDRDVHFNGKSNLLTLNGRKVHVRLIWEVIRPGGRRMWLVDGWDRWAVGETVLFVRMSAHDAPRDHLLVSIADLRATFPRWLPTALSGPLLEFRVATREDLVRRIRNVAAADVCSKTRSSSAHLTAN